MGAEFEKQVSVIMGVYNQWNREALQKAVKSILNQTLTDFEFIIYDDGSDPEVAGYIRELEKLDERIVLIGKEENHGLAFSLNMCIGAAKGKYIARMDADDIALPERLQVQYDFMEQHKEYAWCGCNTRLFDENGIWGERKMPELPSDKDYLPFSPFIHPTVMYRRKLFEKNEGYHVSPETLRCEDYEIFMRLHQLGYQGYNIQEPLLHMRAGSDMYKRRAGWKYAKTQARLFKFMRQQGFIGKGQYIKSSVIRSGSALAPNWLRKFMFEKVLRK